MASKKISAMTVLAAFADTDLIPVVDISETNDSDKNKAAEYRALQRAIARKRTIETKTGDYSIVQDDYYVLIDASGNTVTITLPDATTHQGYEYIIKSTDSTNTATVNTTSSQTIDGSTSVTLASNKFIAVVSDGSNWQIVAEN